MGTPSDPDFDPDLSSRELSVVRRSRRRWIPWAGGLAALGLLFPVSTAVRVPCKLEPIALARITAPRDGAIASRPVPASAPVKAGDVLAAYDTGNLSQQIGAAQGRLERSQSEISRLQHRASSGAAAKLAAKRAAKNRVLGQALVRQGNLERTGAKKKQIAKAKRAVRAAQAAFRAADHQYQALTGEAALARLQASSAKEQARLDDLRRQLAAASIASPAAGLFLPAAPAAGRVTKGQELGRVVKPGTLRLTATLPKSAWSPSLGEAVLQLPAGRKGKLQGLARVDGRGLEAAVEGAAPLEACTATLRIPTGRLPLLLSLVK
ncbi:MAG: efflux RND transporter periplasmic adaptor subunit [Myxococcales bacterium]